MCGIYGKIRFDGRPAEALDAGRACAALRHRGPDDDGIYIKGGVCLGHTRLSIIDLSINAHQPMANEDGSVWIVFNGEIYNFLPLKKELEGRGHIFRSRSDTEVILHLFEDEGPDCIHRLRGMFAVAIWDETARALFLARDHVGKKPLYYHMGKDFIAFCSELPPLVSDPEIPVSVDRIAIHHYLTYQSVPAPYSAFAGIRKLPPGHWMLVKNGGSELRRYWKLSFLPKHVADTAARRAALEEELLETLRGAVQSRMISDVPVGALLSGGVDSGGVVALMAAEAAGNPVKTFTVGFNASDYDELRYAREVSGLFGTDHREITVRPDVVVLLPRLVECFGEPFADSSAIPTYCISKVAREHVKAALCGDGGDENFAGYQRYKLSVMLQRAGIIPGWLSRGALGLLRAVPHGSGIRSPLWIAKRLLQNLSLPPEVRNIRFYGNFDNDSKNMLYTPEYAAETRGINSDEISLSRYRETDADNLLDAMLYADIHTYLPDTLLHKVDRASMANSLELRSPLLDRGLMEFAAKLPPGMKIRRLESKYALKKSLERLLPRKVLYRPKMGFAVPLDHWFRAELRGMTGDVLLSDRSLRRGYFREEAIRKMLDEHMRKRWNWQYQIYNLLMLELWHRRFIDR